MSLLASLDLRASRGGTPWHRASALSKLLLGLGLLVGILASHRLETVIVLHAAAWILVLTCGAPVRLVLTAAAYPLFVASLFLIATWQAPLVAQIELLLRPVTAVLVALWLVATTPYPDLLAPISRLLPRSLADGLFLTYRALFDLLERAERMWRLLRVRGSANASLPSRLTTAGQGLATLVLHGLERSQRTYAAMRLRGHTGRVCGCRHYAEFSSADLWVAAMAVAASIAVWFAGGWR
jgi:cobalt/nickel transport system permease protein